jgi:hypothetical protein
MGKTTAALYFARNAQNGSGGDVDDVYTSTKFWLHGKYSMNNLKLEYELDYNFGEHSASMDEAYWGIYGDLAYNAGDLTLGASTFIVSGDDDYDSDEESWFRAVGTTGNDFNSTQIMLGDYMGLMNPDKGALSPFIGSAGAYMLKGYASYKVSPKMSVNGYVAYFGATDEPTGQDDEMGFELGVGMSYKLYSNLTYSAHASFLSTGDFFKGVCDESGYCEADVEDTWVLSHALTMKF